MKFRQSAVATKLLGYSGRMVIVDLSQEKTRIEEIPELICKQFLGGNGFGIRVLYEHQKPRIDPLSPDNVLVFAIGPFCGTVIPCSAKYVIQAKSPLTGFQGESVGSSSWSLAFKRAGYDVLVMKGRAKKPSYLFIDDDIVELRDAKQLMGKDCRETDSIIRETIGDENVRVAAIGPAGENLVRFACVASDNWYAGRTGMGAVLGSKQLKAVAVRGSKTVEVAKIDELLNLCSVYYKKVRSQNSVITGDMGAVGAATPNLSSYPMPIRNFQDADAFEGQELIADDHKGNACASCPTTCKQIYFTNKGPHKDLAHKTGYQAICALGSNCGIKHIPTIAKAEQLCNALGMDIISTGVVVAWAMECFEKGILTLRDTDGLDLSFGKDEALIKIIPKIARREGLGNIMAEGVGRASERIGKGSQHFAMHSKCLEFPGFDVRGLKGTALSFAVSTRGACHMSASVYESEIGGRLDRFRVEKGCGGFVAERENYLTIFDTLMLCKLSADIWTDTYNELAQLYTLVTGMPLTTKELRTVGERIWNMEKAYNLREGWTRKDDSLPPRVFKDPIPDGGAKGSHLTEDEFNFLLNDYYTARGWTSDGIPTKKKLIELGLKDVAKEVGA